ncbi:MAG: glycosyltransferase family 4 protein [Actinobacteria bacterium]|nr:glycosyltransferase family 4 protein [Actinomycetota bacterium]
MDRAPRLLVLDAAYSLATVRSRHLEYSITSRDLDGFFEHVWSVYPMAGTDPDDPSPHIGRVAGEDLDIRNTFIEGRAGRYEWLRRLGPINLIASQVGLFTYLWRLIRKHRISVIRVGDPYYLGVFGLALARLNRIPLVIRINGNYDAIYEQTGRPAYPRLIRSRKLEKRIEHFILPRADLVAGANRNNLEYALANGARPERGTVLRYGSLIDPWHFEDPEERDPIREEISAGTGPLIVYVGRLESVKHVDEVVGAFAVVAAHHTDARLLVIGDGSLRDELMQGAAHLGVGDRTHFVGNRDQEWIARALADADVVASPLTGRALVEAGLSGTVIVAYDIEWHSELLEDGVTGHLVPYRAVESFARVIERCLDDPGEARSLGARCREHVLEMMDPWRLMQHERRVYAELLGISSGSSEGA